LPFESAAASLPGYSERLFTACYALFAIVEQIVYNPRESERPNEGGSMTKTSVDDLEPVRSVSKDLMPKIKRESCGGREKNLAYQFPAASQPLLA
jgi:hypothetical protein